MCFLFVFFYTRELCEESMTHSASSASSLDSHAPSESSSQSHGARWEEQQKVLALEQLCGVFRVDLGHMRSLRLFFRSAGSREGGHTVAPPSHVSCCVLGFRTYFRLFHDNWKISCRYDQKYTKEKKSYDNR